MCYSFIYTCFSFDVKNMDHVGTQTKLSDRYTQLRFWHRKISRHSCRVFPQFLHVNAEILLQNWPQRPHCISSSSLLSCSWRIRCVSCPLIHKMKLVPPHLSRPSYVRSSFGLYCSAGFGILFASILCTCCSHFSWYCFTSFTIANHYAFNP